MKILLLLPLLVLAGCSEFNPAKPKRVCVEGETRQGARTSYFECHKWELQCISPLKLRMPSPGNFYCFLDEEKKDA